MIGHTVACSPASCVLAWPRHNWRTAQDPCEVAWRVVGSGVSAGPCAWALGPGPLASFLHLLLTKKREIIHAPWVYAPFGLRRGRGTRPMRAATCVADIILIIRTLRSLLCSSGCLSSMHTIWLARGLSSLVSRVPSARRGRRRVLASALHQRDRFAHTYITHPHLTHKLHMAAGCPLSAPWLWCAARCRVALGCVVRPGRQGWHALIGGHAHPPATRLVPCNMRAHTATAASAGARRMTTGHAKAASAPSIDTAKKPMTK